MADTKLLPLLTWRSAICQSDLPATARHVALTLSLFMNELGASAYPGTGRLVQATALGESTVRRDLHMLVNRGWLELVEEGGRRGERKRANEYAARIPNPLPLHDMTPSGGDPVMGEPSTPPPHSADPSTTWPPSLHRNSSLNSGGHTNAQKKNPPPRASRIPDPFDVTDDMVAWVSDHFPDVNWELETDKFFDHWKAKSGRDATKSDWPACWRNWMRNSVNFGARR